MNKLSVGNLLFALSLIFFAVSAFVFVNPNEAEARAPLNCFTCNSGYQCIINGGNAGMTYCAMDQIWEPDGGIGYLCLLSGDSCDA